MDELIDVLDERGGPTGEAVPKSEAHRRGLWHRCFHCWILDPAGPYLLVQRRAAQKDTWPGRLDVTAAGHLRSGEEPLDGLRELEEELGISAAPGRLIPLGIRRIEQKIPGGCDREFHEVFLLPDSTPPEEMRLQPGEVDAVLRLRLEDVETLHDGPVRAREWGAQGWVDVTVSLRDFVPNEDGYLLRVAEAARQTLAGKRVS